MKINVYRHLLKATVAGSASVILLCFAWYTVWGEGNNKGEYWTAYELDKECIKTQNPKSWYCYRTEIHRSNAIALAEWGMQCGMIGCLATVGLALTGKDK